jgi:hypothetical protein
MSAPDRRCTAVHAGTNTRCMLAAHPENTPHFSGGARHWGGKCDRCGLPVERAHEGCGVADRETDRDAERRGELKGLEFALRIYADDSAPMLVTAIAARIAELKRGAPDCPTPQPERWVPLCDQPECYEVVTQKDIYGGFHCRKHGTVGALRAVITGLVDSPQPVPPPTE